MAPWQCDGRTPHLRLCSRYGNVKSAGQTLKRGTLIKSIRLTGDPQEIDCKYEGIKRLVLRAEFVRKR